ncbi:MAG: hypothetical protein JRE13_00760, partial [Deltaproteobacteria bacterium]|nr:hypothetical protein [Deltaproteobacteria bacterium]
MTAHNLVLRLGADAAASLGLDLEQDGDIDRWFIAACLLAGRVRAPLALDAWRALERAGLVAPAALAAAGP